MNRKTRASAILLALLTIVSQTSITPIFAEDKSSGKASDAAKPSTPKGTSATKDTPKTTTDAPKPDDAKSTDLAKAKSAIKKQASAASKKAQTKTSAASSSSKGNSLGVAGVEEVTPKPIEGIYEYKLKSNGLQILMVPRKGAPVVTTTVVYHVGSRNEAVGYTGSTHFLEHMMFKGTKKFDPQKGNGLDNLLKPVGGVNNATTWLDRTNYFEVVPSTSLNLCLELEADRMKNLLLRETDRTSEMTVVRNELERSEDEPDQLLEVNLFATAYREHPYHHPTIGWRSDVEGVPTARLRQFYKDFYWPNNATLMVLGDFDRKAALQTIVKFFGQIPKASTPFPAVYTKEPPQEGERRFVVKRGSDLPRAIMAWHTPEAVHPDTYPLDIIQTILGDHSKKSSRLYKRLINTGIASKVVAINYSLRDPGLFVASATATPGGDPAKIESALREEVAKFAKEDVTDEELDRAKKSIIKRLKLAKSDQMRMSDLLTDAIAMADWKWLMNYPKQIEKVTKADLKRAAAKYFLDDNITVGHYFPKAAPAAASTTEKPASNEAASGTEKPVEPAASSSDSSSTTADSKTESSTSSETDDLKIVDQKTTQVEFLKSPVTIIRYSNGLTVVLMPFAEADTVAVSGMIRAGYYFKDKDHSQVPELVAEMLTKGSKKYSKEVLAQKLEDMGASLDFETDLFNTTFNTEVVSEDLDLLTSIVSDTVRNPLFPSNELEQEKKLQSSDITEKMVDTGEVAWNGLSRALYKPDSVYFAKTFKEQIDEISKTSASDLQQLHSKYYTPGNTVLAFVGDVSAKRITDLVKKHFSSWKGSEKAKIEISNADLQDGVGNKQLVFPLPDKANADIYIGHPINLSIKSPDYYSMLIANAALGFDSFACRLAPVRDVHGLSYGIFSAIQDDSYPLGAWFINFSVNPINTKKALTLVDKITGDYVKGGITDLELSNEKSHLKGLHAVRLRAPKQLAVKLCKYESLGLGPKFFDQFREQIGKPTRAQVNACIAKYMKLKDCVTAMSGTFTPPKKQEQNASDEKKGH